MSRTIVNHTADCLETTSINQILYQPGRAVVRAQRELCRGRVGVGVGRGL